MTPYDYLKPTDDQMVAMQRVREASAAYAAVLVAELPDGADKTWCIRNHRTTAMWANVAITREADGALRLPQQDAADMTAAIDAITSR